MTVIPLLVQASRFACHPGRAYRDGFPSGSRGFSIRAERELLPSHASDMLPVRTGQLTGKNLHLQESQPCRPLRGPAPLRLKASTREYPKRFIAFLPLWDLLGFPPASVCGWIS